MRDLTTEQRDFARELREVDGGQHNGSAHDAVRDAWLLANGWRVLRFWNNE
jgi:very-short-patch-repair endonuclease